MNSQGSTKVAVIMGSKSDYPVMESAMTALKLLGISCEAKVLSAHRMPKEMFAFAESARANGYSVIIAGAGGAAHLPGMVAALTTLPVIGVPVPIKPLDGLDSLYSIVQMPKGVPVATVAIGGAYNAGLLAAQILSVGQSEQAVELVKKLEAMRQKMNLEASSSEL